MHRLTVCIILLLSIFAHICHAYFAYGGLSGTFTMCDPKYPCPPGSTCMYNRMAPGLKSCFSGVDNVQKHPGRCPPTSSYGFGYGRRCNFDADCQLMQKCCGNGFGVCVNPVPIPPSPEVTILIQGNMTLETSTTPRFFVGSVSLAQSNGFNVLFDTGGTFERIPLLNNLRDLAGLYPEDIDFVVMSHGHPDHYSNINLFSDVPSNYYLFNVVGNTFKLNEFNTAGSRLFINGDQNLEIIATPGHTADSDTSLVVRNVPGMGTIVLAGDAIALQGDYLTPLQGEDTIKLAQSRNTIVCLADWIVPGHDSMFQATPAYKTNFQCNNQG